MIKNTLEYRLISAHYGDDITKRSKVRLMNHIDEGLIILDAISATNMAKRAYCIHPLIQNDEDLYKNFSMVAYTLENYVVLLAMEYRNIANAWLSDKALSKDPPKLSPLYEVNDMLVADKVQNKKDFEMYHKGTHERSDELSIYFTRWLEELNVSSETYDSLCKILKG